MAIDGWSLVRQPNAPAALYLREWVELLPTEDLRLTVLHPHGVVRGLPQGVESHGIAERAGAWGRLRYEQFDLPRAATRLGCDTLLVLEGGAPIAARTPTAALAAGRPATRRFGVTESLRRAAGQAGRSVADTVLYPADAPSGARRGRNGRPFQPFVSAGFAALSGAGSQAYVLCHGLRREQVVLALAAWTWVDGSLGDYYPLLFLGLDPEVEQFVRLVAAELDLSESIDFRPEVELAELPTIYHAAAAFLGTGLSAWGQPLRWALAAGVPVAALRQEQVESVVGDAGYLAPPGDARALGAACLSLLVQEQLADQLRERGRQIAAPYFGDRPVRELRSMLQAVGRG